MKMKKAWVIFLAIIIPALLLVPGCDSRSGNEVDYEITSINITPRLLYADNANDTYSLITVTVEDNEGYPAAGVAVDLTTDLGHLQRKVFTSDAGVAETTYNDNGKVGIAHITAKVNQSIIIDSVSVQSSPHLDIIYVHDVSEIVNYADNGITFSTLEVKIVDEDGFGATDEEVWFQATLGNILTHVSTDSSGIARTDFWDLGTAGTAVISVYCGLADSTINIVIQDKPEVTGLELDIISNEIKINAVRTIEATATNVMGAVPDGTSITFDTERGYFQVSGTDNTYIAKTVTITTSNGVARAFLNSGQQAGTSRITAEIDGPVLPVFKDLAILPGRPTQMTLVSRNDTLGVQTVIAVGSGETLNVWANVTDSYGNPVSSDDVVILETDLGNILSPVPITEMTPQGNAVSTFSAGVNAGVAQITASVDSAYASTTITVTSDEINSIQFINQEQVSIDIQGTGGDETAELAVNLFDMNGNLIDVPIWVYFKFEERPENNQGEGSNINNNVYNLADYDSTMSSNGVAVVSINSGIEAGIVAIKTECRDNEGNVLVEATKSNIVIQSGFPAECEFTIGGFDSGEEMGGGLWEVEVAALITDRWGNPVGDGTAVFFSLNPNPDYALIVTDETYVGNENASGDTLAGTAFTSIIYDGTYTNETVTVSVDVAGVDFSGALMLPLQNGEITMICVPAHLAWGDNFETPWDDLFTQCRINIRDGQNNPVNKQRIIFTTSLGYPTDEGENGIHPVEDDIPLELQQLWDFEGLNEELITDEHDGYTGPYDGEHGRLYKDVGYLMEECPPPVPAPPGMTTGTITATIFGTPRSSNQTITLFRYAGAEDE